MNIQMERATNTNLSHGQNSREMELVECVRAFGATLLRDTRERERELKNLLDRLDILTNPINRPMGTAPSTPGVSSNGFSRYTESTEFPWQGATRPSLRTSSTFGGSYSTKYRYPSIHSSAIAQTPIQERLRVHPRLDIPTSLGSITSHWQSGAVAPRHPSPSPPADAITLINPFTGQPWPLVPHSQTHESNGKLDGGKPLGGNQSMVPPHTLGELYSKLPRLLSADSAVQVIKETYLLALLRLPPMYFVRVGRVIQDAELSEEDIDEIFGRSDDTWETMTWAGDRSTKLATFKSSWESFAGSLIKEWKTFNVVSVLLLSSVVAILQLQTDPSSACRISALLSLLFGLMSLLYGCLYIIRFGTMKKMYSAARYVESAKSTNKSVFWNAWVLIAMPAVWLSWSIIFFFVCILSYVWQDNSGDTGGHKQTPSFSVKITISVIFFIGLIYFIMVVRAFNRYAEKDSRSQSREGMPGFRHPTIPGPLASPAEGLPEPPTRIPTLQQPLKPFRTFKPLRNINDLSLHMPVEVPVSLRDRDILPEEWRCYTTKALARVWRDRLPENIVDIVNVWNDQYFIPRGVQIIFCMESLETNLDPTTPVSPTLTWDPSSYSGRYVLYITHLPDGKPWTNLTLTMRVNPLPEWLRDYSLEEDVKFVKPLSGVVTRPHVRRARSSQQ